MGFYGHIIFVVGHVGRAFSCNVLWLVNVMDLRLGRKMDNCKIQSKVRGGFTI